MYRATKQCPGALLLTFALLAALQQPAAAARLKHPAASVFDQTSVDLSPYKETGISASMIQGAYCGICDPGFRVQIINQEVFIVGEVQGFQSRNRNIKLALVDVASTYTTLPDVDFVIGTYDWTATTVQELPDFEAGGPVLAQVCSISRLSLFLLIKLCRQSKYIEHNHHAISPDDTQLHSFDMLPFCVSVSCSVRGRSIYASSKAACSCRKIKYCHLAQVHVSCMCRQRRQSIPMLSCTQITPLLTGRKLTPPVGRVSNTSCTGLS